MINLRKNRSLTQRLYLIESCKINERLEREYIVMGSTGNVYHVIIKNSPVCNCPDYKQRNNRCKHIYFILIRIMNINNPDKYEYNDDDLENMFKNIPEITNYLQVSHDVKQNYQKIKNKKISKDLDDFCPICLDELENGENIVTCKFSCGRHVHELCFDMLNRNKTNTECIYCKHSWDEEKYINLVA